MTRTDMQLSEICKLWRAEKPLYLQTVDHNNKPKRVRILGLYIKDGYQLQVKVVINSEKIWRRAAPKEIVLAY